MRLQIAQTLPGLGTGKLGHRADVDGLRAIAVLAILAFHLDLAGFQGGFVGVDIFFVISGFVIVRGALRDLAEGSFSPREFYIRRIRRIVPALIVVLISVLAVGSVVLSPGELKEVADSALATLVFGANFFFHDRAGYFVQAAHVRPLLHMWSLGVEEQFYIAMPLLILATARARRPGALAIAILCILVASFAYCVMASDKHAFYMPMARVWEIAAGASVAVAERRRFVPGPGPTQVMASAGVVCIVFGIAILDGASAPTWMNVVPVLGTAAVLLCGTAEPRGVSGWLGRQPLVLIGQISFSVYLVHWPLIVFWRILVARPLLAYEQVLIALITFAVAAVLWAYVERPFRAGRTGLANKPALAAVASATIAVGAFGAALSLDKGAAWRLNGEAQAAGARLAQALAARPRCERDAAWLIEAPTGHAACRWPASVPGTQFVIWGDSHARALAPELSQRLGKGGATGGVLVMMAACPPLQSVRIEGRQSHKIRMSQDACTAFSETVLRAIERDKPALVVIAARSALSASEYRTPGDGNRRGLVDARDTDRTVSLADALADTLTRLRATGARIVVIGPVPEIDFDVPTTLIRSLRGIGGLPPVSQQAFANRQRLVTEALQRISALGLATVIYPHAAFCDGERCRVADKDRALYVDDNHLSPFGAAQVADLIEEILASKPKPGLVETVAR